MGSIVGGLYATGMSPQEMEDALATMDWDGSFEDKVPRVERPFRRKFDEASFLTKLTFGIEKGHLAFPTGLVQGQKLNFILRQLTLPSALVDDFDKLNIPYRAIATDVASGERIVLRKGNIAEPNVLGAALEAGAGGFVVKRAIVTDLMPTVDLVRDGVEFRSARNRSALSLAIGEGEEKL